MYSDKRVKVQKAPWYHHSIVWTEEITGDPDSATKRAGDDGNDRNLERKIQAL